MPTDWSALLALVFALGLKHGVDADHLAMIDGLTRYNAPIRPRLARWCGLLFSVGHGVVVIAISVSVGALSNRWEVPAWAADTGAWISAELGREPASKVARAVLAKRNAARA